MSVRKLECFICKKIFGVIYYAKTLFYGIRIIEKERYRRKVYQHSNVEQIPSILYFCSKRCKNKYLSEILEKKYKNRRK